MKTRTTNPLEVGLPTLSLKRTLTASCSEVSLDYKSIGTVQVPVSPEPLPKRKLFRPKHQPRPRKLAEMDELTPILGLASLLTEADPQVIPRTPESESSQDSFPPVKKRCVAAVRLNCPGKYQYKKSAPLKTFAPGALSRAATHAAIAYFIWVQKQQCSADT